MSSALDISRQIATGRISASSVLAGCLDAIESKNKFLHAFLSTDPDRARKQAAGIDAKIAAGEPVGLLAGVPVALKDNICTDWGTTTCGSNILRNYQSPFNAHVVDRLEQAGAIVVGKTNLDEFAMGSSTENSAFGASRNPWNTACVPGGSSGGSAAAVAAGMAPLALGSETGGSVRQPASFCNVTGLKPSYGRISRYGLVAFGSSLDQIGPIARDVRDVALLLGVIAGRDEKDSTSADQTVPDYLADLDRPLGPIRIGIAPEYFSEGLDSEVRLAVENAIAVFEQIGGRQVEIHMPRLQYAIACYYIVCTAEASSNLARYDGVHFGHRTAAPTDIFDLYSASRAEGFGPEVKRRIMLGTYVLSSGYYDAYYLKALKVRTLLKQDYDRAFEKVDVILSPTSPVPPFQFGERTGDALSMYLADIYTASANLVGNCAVSIPCGFTSRRLPVGLQLQAPAFAESRLLQVAHAFQNHTDWHTQRPE